MTIHKKMSSILSLLNFTFKKVKYLNNTYFCTTINNYYFIHMKIKHFLLYAALLYHSSFIFGQTNIKMMFYNLLNYPTAPPQNRSNILKDILNAYQPDIFMVCELETEQAAEDILTNSLSEINKNYERAVFITNQSSNNTYSNLQQELFFNADYFTLVQQEEITTYIRDINHYTLQLNSLDNTNPVYLEIYVTHLKASQGTTYEQTRLEMVEQFTASLNSLNPNSYVIFAGDFNFYTSNESGYQKILDNTNHVIMKDVLNLNNTLQSWHTNYNFKEIHTQATRTSNSEFNGYGAGGGLDDRFDFITFSENILSNSAINYVTGSYKSYGNNGNCYNKRIDDASCTGTFDFTLRSNLYLMSDHLPVVAEIESANTLSIDSFNNALLSFKFLNGNTVSNQLNFSVNNNMIGKELHIFNSIGQQVVNYKLSNTNNSVDTSFLAKGVYYIQIQNISKSIKFVKI